MERSLLKCTLDSVSLTNCKLKLFLQKNICLASPGLCSIGQYGHFNLKTREKTLNQETGSVLSIQLLSSYRVSCNNYTHRYACLCMSITVLSLNRTAMLWTVKNKHRPSQTLNCKALLQWQSVKSILKTKQRQLFWKLLLGFQKQIQFFFLQGLLAHTSEWLSDVRVSQSTHVQQSWCQLLGLHGTRPTQSGLHARGGTRHAVGASETSMVWTKLPPSRT